MTSSTPPSASFLPDRRVSFETHLGLRVDVERQRAWRSSCTAVGDPLVRTSFRNVFGYALAAMGHFDEALDLTEDQLADAEHHRLDFVCRTRTRSGARQGGSAKLSRGSRVARRGRATSSHKAGDRTAYHIAWAIRVRTYWLKARLISFSRAAQTIADKHDRQRRLLSCYAVAGGSGNSRLAPDLADEAQSQSIGAETQINVPPHARSRLLRREGDRTEGSVHARARFKPQHTRD